MSTLTDVAAQLDAAREQLGNSSDADVVDALALAGRLRRLVDAAIVELSGEVASRCRPRDLTSMDAARGFRSPRELIQHTVGVEPVDASRFHGLGTAVRETTSLTGEPLPAVHPHLRSALAEGSLSVPAASQILTTLATAAPHLTPDGATLTEQALAQAAPTLSLPQLRVLCRQVITLADPDGTEPVEEDLRSKASLTWREREDGMTVLRGLLHPEQAAYLVTALKARTAPRRAPHFTDVLEVDGDGSDRRSPAARNADALAGIAKDALSHDPGQVAGVPVTVLVTMTVDQLLGAPGAATVDGIDHPVSAGTARRMAANANLIPAVLGTASEPLDLGTTARLASPAQRRALHVRDRGCIWGHCDHPPGPCDVAHLTPWAHGGPTDLNNLALMCRFHHTVFDTEGWQVRADDHGRWLIPPPHVDPTRTPRRAGPIRIPAIPHRVG